MPCKSAKGSEWRAVGCPSHDVIGSLAEFIKPSCSDKAYEMQDPDVDGVKNIALAALPACQFCMSQYDRALDQIRAVRCRASFRHPR